MTLSSCGLVAPLQRDKKRDFAFAAGEVLLLNHVRHVLLTEASTPYGSGELPWRAEFGSQLHVLRHAPIDAASLAMAQAYVRRAFALWLPHLRLQAVTARQEGTVWLLDVAFSSKAKNAHNLQIPLGGDPSIR